MKKIISVILMCAFLVVCTSIPGLSENSDESRIIIDSAGDEVSIPQNVEKVINLVTYGCQAMVGLGLGDYMTGINVDAVESSWMVEMYPRITQIEKFDQEASAEILLRADADLVVVEDAEFARSLRKKGVNAITFSYFSIDEMKQAIEMLGNILGPEANEKCDSYIQYLEGNIKRVSAAFQSDPPRKESLYYINGVSNKGLYKTTGRGSTNSACAELSYTNFATDSLLESPQNRVDSEAILAEDPENIIIGGKYQHVLYEELLENEEWSNNTAVVNGNVFKVPMGIAAWNRYGIEIAIMIPWTTSVVYPEYFEFDAIQETIDFYDKFAGYTLTEKEAQYILEGVMPNGEREIRN